MKSTWMFTLITCKEATPSSAHCLNKNKIKKIKCIPPSWEMFLYSFLSFSQIGRYFKDLILRQPTWERRTAYNICIYFTAHRLPSASTSAKGGIAIENIHTQCISLQLRTCQQPRREAGHGPLDTGTMSHATITGDPQTWPSGKATCRGGSEGECGSRARSTSKRQTTGVRPLGPRA